MLADSQVNTCGVIPTRVEPPRFPNHHFTADAPILGVSSANRKLTHYRNMRQFDALERRR
jgi:hypothetical protein